MSPNNNGNPKNGVQGPGNYRTGSYPRQAPDVSHPDDLLSPTTDNWWQAAVDHEAFPLVMGAAEILFGTLFDHFTTSPEEALLEEQLTEAQRQRLRASGVFSDEDIAQIEEGWAPVVNQVAGNVASRGIGGAAGAEIVAQAQAAPFHKLQAQASQLYQTSVTNAAQFVGQLSQANSVYQSAFGSITQLYEVMQLKSGENGQPNADPLFSEFDELTRRFAELLEKEKQ